MESKGKTEGKIPAGEYTGAVHALTAGPPPGMTCGSRLTDNGDRCALEAGHLGDHIPRRRTLPPAPAVVKNCICHHGQEYHGPIGCLIVGCGCPSEISHLIASVPTR